jgi:hypothetical protein
MDDWDEGLQVRQQVAAGVAGQERQGFVPRGVEGRAGEFGQTGGQGSQGAGDFLTQRLTQRLFLGQRGEPMQTRSVQLAVSRLAKLAGLTAVTPHTCRQTFAKSLLDNDVTLEQVAALLGHESLDTTRLVTIQPCHCEPFFGDREAYPKSKQSPVYQASLTAWGLLRRKERSSQ